VRHATNAGCDPEARTTKRFPERKVRRKRKSRDPKDDKKRKDLKKGHREGRGFD